MQDLQVIGVENGALLVASDDGQRFRIPIDEVLQSKLRQSVPVPGSDKKLSPREIQSLIRGGMSAQEVADHTGVALEYIEKFEGPVMAEREFVVESAFGVPVHTALETDPNSDTFGAVISGRLEGLSAEDVRWASWKDETSGWIVKVSFTADRVDHDARWQFDPKKLALSPLNSEAVTLSQQGEATGVLIPRLRAVGNDRQADTSRFDSGAFLVDEAEPANNFTTRVANVEAAAEADGYQKNQTQDLLEALRRRRGERETASYADEEAVSLATQDHPSAGGIRLVTVPLDDYFDETPEPDDDIAPAEPQNSGPIKPLRKGRATMPSWDDIVFGARTDDDLA